MSNRKSRAACGLLLAALAAPAGAETLVARFSGERSGTTPPFEVKAPWILDWRVTGEYSRIAAVDVSLINASTGAHEGTVLRAESAGNGVRLFDQSGDFYFRVDSSVMAWHLKVIELTPEEAKLYTPKPRSLLDQ